MSKVVIDHKYYRKKTTREAYTSVYQLLNLDDRCIFFLYNSAYLRFFIISKSVLMVRCRDLEISEKDHYIESAWIQPIIPTAFFFVSYCLR